MVKLINYERVLKNMRLESIESFEVFIKEFLPRELTLHPFKWVPMVSDQNKKLIRKNFHIVKIKPIEVPRDTIVVPLNIFGRKEVEIVDVLISEKPGYIDSAIVYAQEGVELSVGEVLGIVKISHAIPSEESRVLTFFQSLLHKLQELELEVEEKFEKSKWPIW